MFADIKKILISNGVTSFFDLMCLKHSKKYKKKSKADSAAIIAYKSTIVFIFIDQMV